MSIPTLWLRLDIVEQADAKLRAGAGYRGASVLLRPLLQAITRREWTGAEHIPERGGVIVAANHLSHFDPLVLGHFVHDRGRPVRFLGKQGLFDVPVFGRLLTSAGQIPVSRGTRNAGAALRFAEAAIERGECLVIYPEGTITRDPDLWPMVGKNGMTRLAVATGCEIVPVAQWGAQEVLAPYTKVPRLLPRKTMRVAAGPPVDLSEFRRNDLAPGRLKEATERVMAAITGLLEEMRCARAPRERFDPAARGMPETGNFRKAMARKPKRDRR